MKNRLLFFVGAFVIFFSLFGTSLTQIVEEQIDIGIERPSQELIDRFDEVSSIVTEDEDRIRLAIFNKVFADRLMAYETTQQQLNDVYVLAAKGYFKDSMKDKYKNLDTFLKNAIRDVSGDQVHVLSDVEKADLKLYFTSIAWCLTRK